jgi:hypothetical protein
LSWALERRLTSESVRGFRRIPTVDEEANCFNGSNPIAVKLAIKHIIRNLEMQLSCIYADYAHRLSAEVSAPFLDRTNLR